MLSVVVPERVQSTPLGHASGALVCVFMKKFFAAWSHSVAPALDQ
jgi:hypothetical protein